MAGCPDRRSLLTLGMPWKAFALLLVLWTTYAPFANATESACATASCCAQMESCCAHCPCSPHQSCAVTKPVTVDQQTLARTTQLSPRVEVMCFALNYTFTPMRLADRQTLSRRSESPPIDTSQKPQARLCLWLI